MKSRRAFLRAATAVPMFSRVSTAAAPTAATLRDSSFDPWIEIDAAAFKWNIVAIERRVDGRPILAVIKNNGYGAGVVEVARILDPLDAVARFAVVKLHEPASIRAASALNR